MQGAAKPESSNKGCKLLIRITNIATALVLIGFGIAGIIVMSLGSLLSGKFFLVFSPVFMILFGIMVIAGEFKVKLLLKHFAFLGSLMGRGIFNLYLCTAVFFYFTCGTDDVVVAWIAAGVIFALGIFYIVMHFISGKQYSSDLKEQMM